MVFLLSYFLVDLRYLVKWNSFVRFLETSKTISKLTDLQGESMADSEIKMLQTRMFLNCSTLKKTIFEKKWLFDFTYLLFAQLTKLP